ncbi:hypothetical protein SLA2020_376040 [Shorea laevis]
MPASHHLLLLRFFPFSSMPESRRVFGLQTRRRPQEFPESSQFRRINQSISRKAVRPLVIILLFKIYVSLNNPFLKFLPCFSVSGSDFYLDDYKAYIGLYCLKESSMAIGHFQNLYGTTKDLCVKFYAHKRLDLSFCCQSDNLFSGDLSELA